jgi:tRNA A-37 threonylcarbamoyl transferase component Bud32
VKVDQKTLEDYIEAAKKGKKGRYKKNSFVSAEIKNVAKCLFNDGRYQPGKRIGADSASGIILVLCDKEKPKCNEENYNGYIVKYQNTRNTLQKEVDKQIAVYNIDTESPIAPNIITPVIQCDNGEMVIMEYIEGNTFAQIVPELFKCFMTNRDELLKIMAETFQILDKLHEANMYHGDLHINNIMRKVDRQTKKKKMILIDFESIGKPNYYSEKDRPIYFSPLNEATDVEKFIRKLSFFGFQYDNVIKSAKYYMRIYSKEVQKDFYNDICKIYMENNPSKFGCIINLIKYHANFFNEYRRYGKNEKTIHKLFSKYVELARIFNEKRERVVIDDDDNDDEEKEWGEHDCKVAKWFLTEYANTYPYKYDEFPSEFWEVLTSEDYNFDNDDDDYYYGNSTYYGNNGNNDYSVNFTNSDNSNNSNQGYQSNGNSTNQGSQSRLIQSRLIREKQRSNNKIGGKKVRKHRGVTQTGGNAGRLRKGYRYSGKKLKSGLPQIVKAKSKKN